MSIATPETLGFPNRLGLVQCRDESVPLAASTLANYRVRPLQSGDLGPLMKTVGTTVDALYPDGGLLLCQTLEEAIAGYSRASVVVRADVPGKPLALAAERFKGAHRVKLSTFWVSPDTRRHGVGGLLLSTVIRKWKMTHVGSASVTVREARSEALESLFSRQGFTRLLTDLNRYGDGEHEVVLTWSASTGMPCQSIPAEPAVA